MSEFNELLKTIESTLDMVESFNEIKMANQYGLSFRYHFLENRRLVGSFQFEFISSKSTGSFKKNIPNSQIIEMNIYPQSYITSVGIGYKLLHKNRLNIYLENGISYYSSNLAFGTDNNINGTYFGRTLGYYINSSIEFYALNWLSLNLNTGFKIAKINSFEEIDYNEGSHHFHPTNIFENKVNDLVMDYSGLYMNLEVRFYIK